MEDPGGSEKTKYGGWTFPYWNDEIGKVKFDELFAADALLLGRVTYQGFAEAWPDRTDEAGFANRMNSIPKYVVTSSLKEVIWNNSKLIPGNFPEEISYLKQQPGKDILVAGSRSLVNALLEHHLVNELRLLVYPVILGTGKKLFKEGEKDELELLEAKQFRTGVVMLHYRLCETQAK
jgi:dihydrofolate reductase